MLGETDDSPPPHSGVPGRENKDDSIFNQDFLMRVASERGNKRQLRSSASLERGGHDASPPGSPGTPSCSTTILILVVHAGSVLGSSDQVKLV